MFADPTAGTPGARRPLRFVAGVRRKAEEEERPAGPLGYHGDPLRSSCL